MIIRVITLLLVSAGFVLAAENAVDFRVLATNRTSTMEKELNEASDAGFRMDKVMGGNTEFGGSEVVVVMSKKKEPIASAAAAGGSGSQVVVAERGSQTEQGSAETPKAGSAKAGSADTGSATTTAAGSAATGSATTTAQGSGSGNTVTVDKQVASMSITSTPPGADIFVNGSSIRKKTPASVTLPPGQYKISLRLRGFEEFKKTIDLNDKFDLAGTLKKEVGGRPTGKGSGSKPCDTCLERPD